jgi:nucleotide-binding universal stress UspA family protein
LGAPVVLLGMIEDPGQQEAVEQVMEETAQKLRAAQVDYRLVFEKGRGPAVIASYAHRGRYITVFGPFGRPAWKRIVQGRSFRRVLERVETPLLYVRQAHLQLRRILICMGGLDYAASVEHLGLYLAQAVNASVTLLHIVEPITRDYPVARELHDHWREILETDTPQGRNLKAALEEVKEAGLQADFKVRHGSVVHEILDEVHGGGYDLVGMGSAYSAHSLRHLYTPNVTAEVAEVLDIPVLTVRQGYDLL